MVAITNKEFNRRIKSIYGEEYSIISPYKTMKDPVMVKHNTCGKAYKALPKYLLENMNLCPNSSCKKKRKLVARQLAIDSHAEAVAKRVIEESNGEYTISGKYQGYGSKVEFTHKKCGNTFISTPANFFSGNRCTNKSCLQERKRLANPNTKTSDEFFKEVYSLVGDEFYVSGKYINWKTKMKFVHRKCGKEFYEEANSFLQRKRCPYCARIAENKRRSKKGKDFLKEVREKYGKEYTVTGVYVNNHTKISIIHNKCGRSWKTIPANFLYGFGCPYCKSSKGEKLVEKYLDKSNIRYEAQKKFNNLQDKSYLSYDFFLPDKNVLIEYQGQQHYFPVNIFGGEKSFAKQKNHDEMKRRFAKENNFTLIEISYKINDYGSIKNLLNYKLKFA